LPRREGSVRRIGIAIGNNVNQVNLVDALEQCATNVLISQIRLGEMEQDVVRLAVLILQQSLESGL
jgi:hypothetical protein